MRIHDLKKIITTHPHRPTDERDETGKDHPLAFARGFMIGVPISLVLWALIFYAAVRLWG